ncbi:putative lipoprotein, partial [Vibrio parahaemolyticus EKP-021]
MRRYHLLLRR